MIELRRSVKSEAKRLELSRFCPTWGSCFRLVVSYNGDPGSMGQKVIRSKAGLVWQCVSPTCAFDVPHDDGPAPDVCPECGTRRFVSTRGTICYIHDGRGAGSRELRVQEIALELDRWLDMVSPTVTIYRVASLWLNAWSWRAISRAVGRRHTWCRDEVLPAFKIAWEQEGGARPKASPLERD